MLNVVFNESFHAALSEIAPVVCFGLNLDMGDISASFDSQTRQTFYKHLYTHIPFTDEEIDAIFKAQTQAYHTILETVKQNKIIQVWVDQTPESRCGLLHLCYVLKDLEAQLERVELCEIVDKGDNCVMYSGWKEIGPHDINHATKSVNPIRNQVKSIYAAQWERLIEAHTPLRVVLNGCVTSVGETFFDPFIDTWAPEGPFIAAQLIGYILGNEAPGISDAWLYQRILHYVDFGRFEVIEKSDDTFPYGDVLVKKT